MGVTQVTGQAGCGGHSGDRKGWIWGSLGWQGELGQSGSGRKDLRVRTSHFVNEGTEVQGRGGRCLRPPRAGMVSESPAAVCRGEARARSLPLVTILSVCGCLSV